MLSMIYELCFTNARLLSLDGYFENNIGIAAEVKEDYPERYASV